MTKLKEEKLVSALVAPGRTVVDSSGKSVGPGRQAKILAEELERLCLLGFLVKSGESAVVRSGPVTLIEKG